MIEITPELAMLWLQRNTKNRAKSQRQIAKWAKAMSAGEWRVNGSAICFTVSGVLVDGQHRLEAVVKSGVTIKSWVIFGLDEDIFAYIDTGKMRSAGDTLSSMNRENYNRLAALLKRIDKYMTGRIEVSVNYENSDIVDLLERYPDADEFMMTGCKQRGLLLPSVLDLCCYLFNKKDPLLAQQFIEKVIKGVNLEEGCPFYVLRARLVNNSMQPRKLPDTHVLALCIKAWNHARSGVKITKLQLNTGAGGKLDNFPIVL